MVRVTKKTMTSSEFKDSQDNIIFDDIYDAEIRKAERKMQLDMRILSGQLNEKQREFFNEVIYEEPRVIFLTGSAGTGKSMCTGSTIRALILKDPELKIAVCAPSHKAKSVLEDSLMEAGVDMAEVTVVTIHKLLGYALVEEEFDDEGNVINPDVANTLQRIDGNNTLVEFGLVVLDEAGMASKEMIDILIDESRSLIMMGDIYQLSPIGSEPYDFGDIPTIELTENMRQSTKDSKLIEYIDMFKDGVRNNIDHKPLFTSDDTVKISTNLAKDYLAGSIEVIGCFTNNFVNTYNDIIQRSLHGSTEPVDGQTIIVTKPYRKWGNYGKKGNLVSKATSIHNGYELKIENLRTNSKGFLTTTVTTFSNADGKETHMVILLGPEYKDNNALFAFYKENYNWKRDRISWKQFKCMILVYQFKHAVTIHKLQGVSVKSIGINASDIYDCWDTDTRNRLFYVGLSRAKETVYIRQ